MKGYGQPAAGYINPMRAVSGTECKSHLYPNVIEPGPPVADQRYVLRRPEVSGCLPELSAFVQAAIPKNFEQDAYIDWLSSLYCLLLRGKQFQKRELPAIAILCTQESVSSARGLVKLADAFVPGWFRSFGLVESVSDVWCSRVKESVTASQTPEPSITHRQGPRIILLPEDQLRMLYGRFITIRAGAGAELPDGLPGIHGFARWLVDVREYGGYLHETVKARRAAEVKKQSLRTRNLAVKQAVAGRDRLARYAADLRKSQALRLKKYKAIAKLRAEELLARQNELIAARTGADTGGNTNEQ
jgi:hypothetical protein